jgi:hypothetical protein
MPVWGLVSGLRGALIPGPPGRRADRRAAWRRPLLTVRGHWGQMLAHGQLE